MSLGVIMNPSHVPSWLVGKKVFASIVCVGHIKLVLDQ